MLWETVVDRMSERGYTLVLYGAQMFEADFIRDGETPFDRGAFKSTDAGHAIIGAAWVVLAGDKDLQNYDLSELPPQLAREHR